MVKSFIILIQEKIGSHKTWPPLFSISYNIKVNNSFTLLKKIVLNISYVPSIILVFTIANLIALSSRVVIVWEEQRARYKQIDIMKCYWQTVFTEYREGNKRQYEQIFNFILI